MTAVQPVSLAPIALFAYNRPLHLKQAVAALRNNALAISTSLHVFSDGPKTFQAESAVAQVRAFARTIEGFGSVTLHERERNLGLANSIIDGVTRMCEEHGRAIVVEDDLLVAPHFLEYMNEALDRYRDERRAMQISGYMFPVDMGAETDALFLPFTTSWGWATWARAWSDFDPKMQGFERLAADRALRDEFNLEGAYDYFDLLRRQCKGQVDSWAIRWYLSVFMQRGLTLYPARTLVRNIGFDGSGTHCADGAIDQSPLTSEFRVEKFPAQVELFPHWRTVLSALPERRGGLRKLLRRARRLLPGGVTSP